MRNGRTAERAMCAIRMKSLQEITHLCRQSVQPVIKSVYFGKRASFIQDSKWNDPLFL